MLHEILETTLHSIVSVSILFVLARLMGKKQISQLTLFDYVVGISIGSIASAFAVEKSISFITGVTGMVVYALFPILLSYISLKSITARKILDGKPAVLIQNGRIVEEGLRKTKMNINDLLEECRLKNAFCISDIDYAILETSGKVSILMKPPFQPLTPTDMNITTQYKGLCVNLIIDGNVQDKPLKMLGKDMGWLEMELKKQGIRRISDVLLAYVDSSDQLSTFLKNNDPPPAPIS